MKRRLTLLWRFSAAAKQSTRARSDRNRDNGRLRLPPPQMNDAGPGLAGAGLPSRRSMCRASGISWEREHYSIVVEATARPSSPCAAYALPACSPRPSARIFAAGTPAPPDDGRTRAYELHRSPPTTTFDSSLRGRKRSCPTRTRAPCFFRQELDAESLITVDGQRRPRAGHERACAGSRRWTALVQYGGQAVAPDSLRKYLGLSASSAAQRTTPAHPDA